MKLIIQRAKPNPAGKDTNRHKPLAAQLLGETVDIENTDTKPVNLGKCRLAHTEFDAQGRAKPQPVIYWTGAAIELKPGEMVRIHTGKSKDVAEMHAEDKNGVHHHTYAESHSFVLNNKEGDKLYLYSETALLDSASYDPAVGEGVTLIRKGDKLVAPAKSGGTGPWTAPAVIGTTGKAA